MKKTNFDKYLGRHLKNPDFAHRFKEAGQAWDIAVQLVELRKRAGLTQIELARKAKTSTRTIEQIESGGCGYRSVNVLNRIAGALNATIHIAIQTKIQRKSKTNRKHLRKK